MLQVPFRKVVIVGRQQSRYNRKLVQSSPPCMRPVSISMLEKRQYLSGNLRGARMNSRHRVHARAGFTGFT